MKYDLRLSLAAILVLLLFAPVSGGETLSDAQKKEIVYAMYTDYKKDFPTVKEISPAEAMALLRANQVIFVDTRKSEEMAISMLPGAVSEEEFVQHPGQYAGLTPVAYCTISYRSGKFAEAMGKKGRTIYNLRGGLLAWVLEGGKVYDKKGESRHIHVYGKKWNYPAQGYEAVMFGLFDRWF
ncbi:rhodanese-like domain-containing protein [Desulfonema ishimotonii]|uniref:Rhodanese-like domain-containing protein n=2 Tax=Desulfonema ishimotonii TaxID=45657 RepID=A0A401FZJ8_9BACT|nr:rhodanese-like domain-containing protein [Desulfonema ishimotonii]